MVPSGKQCMIGNCHNIAVAKGLCDMHRKRLERHGDVIQTRPADWGARERHPLYPTWNWMMRAYRAHVCERWHDLWNFVADVDERPTEDHRLKRIDAEKPYGPGNVYWKEPIVTQWASDDARERRNAYRRNYYHANQRFELNKDLKKRYGITLEDYERMLAEQNGTCAICGKVETRVDHRTKRVSRLAVDHCHKTEQVRGLLCHAHNNSLGHFDDDPSLLASAIVYLSRYAADSSALLKDSISTLQAALPCVGRA